MPVRARPMVLVAALGVAVLCAVWPWGNYPLNDDWQYAWIAKRFAETGRFVVDVPIAPTLVGQSLIAAQFIKLFGFSHTLLRCVTLLLSGVCLLFMNGILGVARVPDRVRALALTLLVLNPIYLNLSASFMTEIYGLAVGLGAVWLWMRDRSRHETGAL